VPLVEGVVESLSYIAAGEVPLALREDEAVEFFGDGTAAGAADECAAGGWRGGLAGLLFDVIDALDVEQDGDGDFGGGFPEIGKLAAGVGEAAGVAEAVLGGDAVVNAVAVGMYESLIGDGVGFPVIAEEV
jgi:hypothetical protein